MATKSRPSTDSSKTSAGRGPAKADASKRKKSSSRIVPAPNLPAFAYKDANPGRHISHLVGTQSRQGSIEDLAADKTNERSHSRLSQAGKLAPAQPGSKYLWVWLATASVFFLLVVVFLIVLGILKGGSTDGRSSTTNKS
ncbi:hypothetical protein HPB52_010047 [Rhipicephalus sanguineus]|uniref:Uncharacterized protein n=1 Tax=Rhipicephalus sanguineus TaxID=34632 RepID=A0A9D4T9A3_RHISA|nr:hypothetical protein HPB52_010047 [Rhipicephalus sanguineus]